MLPRLLQVNKLGWSVRAEKIAAREVMCGGVRSGALLLPHFSRGLEGLQVPTSRPNRMSHSSSNSKAEEVEGGQRASTARLVVTHSSYMDGLIPLLDRFVTDPDAACSISSVVPGRMYSCNGRSELFKMTVRATNNGFKALARKGTAGQEVFISTTTMEMEDVKAALNRAAGFDLEKGGSRREHKAGRKRR